MRLHVDLLFGCWSAPPASIPAVYSSPLPRFIRPSRTPVLTPCRECARYSPDRAQRMVGVAGFEPATSSFRTKSASRLRYTPEVARCTGLEPVSLDRQSSCLTRCITAQRDPGATRKLGGRIRRHPSRLYPTW